MTQKLRMFKGKMKSVESEVNEFLTPKVIKDGKEEQVNVKLVLQSSYDTLEADKGVVMSIFYTTSIVHVLSSSRY